MPGSGARTMVHILWFSTSEMCTIGNSLRTGGNWWLQGAECTGENDLTSGGQGFSAGDGNVHLTMVVVALTQ